MSNILLNAFDMNSSGHQSPGLWKHPRDRSHEFNKISYWVELAQTLERGYFDGIFLADVLGVYDVYGGNPDAALKAGVQIPNADPMLIVPSMAAATNHIGFGITCTLSYEPPYPFARRMSTLDHLTNGRVGWNIVTGYLDSAARGGGMKKQVAHDQRYEMAAEYMELMYKLWEESWADDAVVRDRERGIYTDPSRVKRITHDGEYYSLDAMHLCQPSPQRTPVLYQAGASSSGLKFAAKHAECVFMNGPSAEVLKRGVAKLRDSLPEFSRRSDDVKIFAGLTIIVDDTDALANERLQDYRQYIDPQGALALLSGWTGIDFSTYDLDAELKHIKSEAIQTAVDRFTVSSDRVWTVRELAEFVGLGGAGPILIGSPETVASKMIEMRHETGVDGFNLMYSVAQESMSDFVDKVVPQLQERGVYKTSYSEGTLRRKLFGEGDLTNGRHTSSAYRPSSA